MEIYTKELKDFVTTLEQSKRLEELGADYETKFVWYIQRPDLDTSIRRRDKVTKFFDNEIHSAFTAEELLDIVYDELEWFDEIYLTINKDTGRLVDNLYNLLTKSTESGAQQ